MPAKKPEVRTRTTTLTKTRPTKRPKKRAAATKEKVLERVLAQVEAPSATPEVKARAVPAAHAVPLRATAADPQLRPVAIRPLQIARVVAVEGRIAEVVFRGETSRTTVALGEDVETEVVAAALKNRDPVLVERSAGPAVDSEPPPVVLGVLSARRPRELHLRADTITLEAAREVLLRSGTGALRIREDGDVELVGSRILAMSRGLFRIVGRMLRLN